MFKTAYDNKQPFTELSFDRLSEMYCERQLQDPESLKRVLIQKAEVFKCDGFMLLECQQMDSSYFGSYTILPYGPNNTFKYPPEGVLTPRGLASDNSVVVGVIPVSALE